MILCAFLIIIATNNTGSPTRTSGTSRAPRPNEGYLLNTASESIFSVNKRPKRRTASLHNHRNIFGDGDNNKYDKTGFLISRNDTKTRAYKDGKAQARPNFSKRKSKSSHSSVASYQIQSGDLDTGILTEHRNYHSGNSDNLSESEMETSIIVSPLSGGQCHLKYYAQHYARLVNRTLNQLHISSLIKRDASDFRQYMDGKQNTYLVMARLRANYESKQNCFLSTYSIRPFKKIKTCRRLMTHFYCVDTISGVTIILTFNVKNLLLIEERHYNSGHPIW